jgi:hypothetical protein
MDNTIMNLKDAISTHNSKVNSREVIREEIEKLTLDLSFEVLDNEKDNDLKIALTGDCISTDNIRNLEKKFQITYINIEDHTLEIDLRLHDD